ncbi:hypothetical protein NUW54_g12304 [Trametes sanguinea]|uniref:Uncharacterized protein n=1 Tax=Trametes sanguinea TaxID=158606 RepID=A0ACC1N0I1_9APHY|nr:hypothetical protein NUW54_g12304 [Trametes sanguinea]
MKVDGAEGGDYVEHDDFSDDEDEFGDDLPQEVGGHTADEAYTHHGVTEGGAQYSTYAADSGALDAPDEDSNDLAASASVTHLDDEDDLQQSHDDGLNTSEPTNIPDHLNSIDGQLVLSRLIDMRLTLDTDKREETLDATHSVDSALGNAGGAAAAHTDEGDADGESFSFLSAALDADGSPAAATEEQAHDESTTLSSDDEDGLIDDWDEGEAAPAEPAADSEQHVDGLSRKSSTATLASKTSKRAYDEVELDDFDDDPSQVAAASSPATLGESRFQPPFTENEDGRSGPHTTSVNRPGFLELISRSSAECYWPSMALSSPRSFDSQDVKTDPRLLKTWTTRVTVSRSAVACILGRGLTAVMSSLRFNLVHTDLCRYPTFIKTFGGFATTRVRVTRAPHVGAVLRSTEVLLRASWSAFGLSCIITLVLAGNDISLDEIM